MENPKNEKEMNLNALKQEAQAVTGETAVVASPVVQPATTENQAEDNIFDFGSEDAVPKSDVPEKAPDGSGGIIIEHEQPKNTNIVVGALGDKERQGDIEKTFREVELMIDINKKMAAVTKRHLDGDNAQKEISIIIDKSGLGTVEFTPEEKKKIEKSTKIKLVEVDEARLKTIEIRKPKKDNVRTIIERTYDKSFSPFVAIASGYTGKMRNLSSMEVINLVSARERSETNAEYILQQWSLIYSRLRETSIGDFDSFDEFIKNSAILDLENYLYAIITATYPNEDEITLQCGNPNCTETVKGKKRQRQFIHKYENKDLLLKSGIAPEAAAMTQYILSNSFILDDAKKIHNESILKINKRIALDEEENVIIEIYCPSVYEVIERIAKRLLDGDFKSKPEYSSAINLTQYIQKIYLKQHDEDGSEYYYEIEDPVDIVETVYSMSDRELELTGTAIRDNITKYSYNYGFSKDKVICPHCGYRFKEDISIELEYLLFLLAQRHSTRE